MLYSWPWKISQPRPPPQLPNKLLDNCAYKAALREVSAYFDNEPEPGTADGNRFEALLARTETYEAKYADTSTTGSSPPILTW
jgi:antitoxin component HigA of HigAB toxin-antitoxin module